MRCGQRGAGLTVKSGSGQRVWLRLLAGRRIGSADQRAGMVRYRDRGEWHDGRLTILGRMDNLFFSGGEGIQPESLERVIAAIRRLTRCLSSRWTTPSLDSVRWRWWSASRERISPVYLTGSGIRWRVLNNPSAGCCCRPNSKMAALSLAPRVCSSG